MPRGNPSPKLAITIDPAVHENIVAAAARDGLSISACITMAALPISKWNKPATVCGLGFERRG